MRKILLLFVGLLFLGGVNAQQILRSALLESANNTLGRGNLLAGEPSLEIGYCTSELYGGIGAGANAKLKAAIQFPKEMMSKYVGNKLTQVLIGIGKDAGKDAKVFLTYNLDEEPFYIQDVTFTKNQWNTITLETPYNIEDKELFIGYSLTAGSNAQTSVPIGFDEGPAESMGDLVAYESNGAYVWIHLGERSYGNVSIKGVLEGNSLPQYDVTLRSVKAKGYVRPEAKFSIGGEIKNNALEAINSFDVTYEIGEASPVTVSIKDVSLPTSGKYTFAIDDVTIPSTGNYTLKVTVSKINGQADQFETDNVLTKEIVCSNDFVDRKVILEHFTTAQCGNCPEKHELLEKVLGGNENVVWVAHHVGYLTDTYTISESSKYTRFFGEGAGEYAPAIMFDRTNLANEGAQTAINGSAVASLGPVFFPFNEKTVSDLLNVRLDEAAFVEVIIEPEYDRETRELTVKVSGHVLKDLGGEDIRLNVFLTEDNLIGSQSGGGSKYQHNHVIRAVLTGVWGEAVTFEDGKYSATYTYTLKSAWKPGNVKAIAFLSNYDSKDLNNCEVYNAESILIDPTSVETVGKDDFVAVCANQSSIVIDGEYAVAYIYDTTGKLITAMENGQQTFSTQNGIYFVKVVKGDKAIVKKVVVQK